MSKDIENGIQELFAGVECSLCRTDPEFVEIISNFSQNEVVIESKLTEKEQILCILSVLLGCQGIGEFQNMLHAALIWQSSRRKALSFAEISTAGWPITASVITIPGAV